MTTLEQEVDLLSALGIWEVDELEMQKENVSNTNKQFLYHISLNGHPSGAHAGRDAATRHRAGT